VTVVRVLIVDDQAPFKRSARAVVDAMEGFEVVGEASSGEQAVDLVGSLAPDLVLMDVVMDGIGGVEAARRIAARHPRTQTLLVSSYAVPELEPAVSECGALGFVAKVDFGTRVLAELWDRRA
jgi:DNA-binding NarL/FixJ family response regulator